MNQKFDIPVNIEVYARNESDAEQRVLLYLREAAAVISNPDIGEYEIFEFVPADLSQSCCC